MDRIALHGFRVLGRHGANPGEREREQPFDIDLVFEIDLTHASQSDRLDETVSYAEVHAAFVRTVSTTSFELLERLANVLLDELFLDARIARAELTLAKPELLNGATPSVTLVREKPEMARVYVGIGSNLGDSADRVRVAIVALDRLGTVLMRSSLYRTAPWGKLDQPEFINAVALLETDREPHVLLDELQALERELGRVPSERWGPRAIDLDILLYDDVAIDDVRLRVPHAQLRRRAFVLVPLAELDGAFAPWRDVLSVGELAKVQPL